MCNNSKQAGLCWSLANCLKRSSVPYTVFGGYTLVVEDIKKNKYFCWSVMSGVLTQHAFSEVWCTSLNVADKVSILRIAALQPNPIHHCTIAFSHANEGCTAFCLGRGCKLEASKHFSPYLCIGLLATCGSPCTYGSYETGVSSGNARGHYGARIWCVWLPQDPPLASLPCPQFLLWCFNPPPLCPRPTPAANLPALMEWSAEFSVCGAAGCTD